LSTTGSLWYGREGQMLARTCNAVCAAGLVIGLGGCLTPSGSVDLVLTMPTDPDLQPQNMTTVDVIATGSNGIPITSQDEIIDNAFTAGNLPVENGVQIDVLLRDVSDGLVGVGESSQLVDVIGDKSTTLSMPVRRPFVYAADGSNLYSFDPSLDSRGSDFQGQLMGVTAPMFAISANGDRLAVVSQNAVQVIDTGTNMVIGSPITLPASAQDAAPVPGSHTIVVATSSGISIIDLDSGSLQTAKTASVDRVTVGANGTGGFTAFGLVGAVTAPTGPLDACAGSSAVVAVDVDSTAAAPPMASPIPLSDLAADPQQALLFATDPCDGEVVRLDISNGDAAMNPSQVSTLSRANVLAVLGGRVWAAGTAPSTLSCIDANGDTVACTAQSSDQCPITDQNLSSYIAFTDNGSGAALIVQSIATGNGSDIIQFDVPARSEGIVATDDPGQSLTQTLPALSVVPVDLVALPGGQYVSVVAQSQYYVFQTVETGGGEPDQTLLPCLYAQTSDWLQFDMASLSVANRVRTQCDLTVGQADPPFVDWACAATAPNETSNFGDYTPASVGALFGAR
jgi:hypothetical protein